MPLLLAVAVTALVITVLMGLFTVTSVSGTFIDQPHPAQEWVLPGWSVLSTLEQRRRDFCRNLNFPVEVTALLLGSQKKTVAAGAGIEQRCWVIGQNGKVCQSRMGRREVAGEQQKAESGILTVVKTIGWQNQDYGPKCWDVALRGSEK